MAGIEMSAAKSPRGRTRTSLRAPFTSRRFRTPDPGQLTYDDDELQGSRTPIRTLTETKQNQAKSGLIARLARSSNRRPKEESLAEPPEYIGPHAIHRADTVPETPTKSSFRRGTFRTAMTIETSTSSVTPRFSSTALSTTPTLVPKPSRMTLRSKLHRTKSKTPRAAPGPTPEAPPLFQAYSRAIKHASLTASTLSAETILRHHNHSRKNSRAQDALQGVVTGDADQPNGITGYRKEDKLRGRHRRKSSAAITNADWTNKVYVLLTSGCLLQYAGDGSFNRLPERVMQLGKDSVAFASDVIPGKHWVLQVSQDVSGDGDVPVEAPRSLFSKLSFRGTESQRPASSFLLVLDNPEDLHSWMFAVRQEIELLGGTRHEPEAGMAGRKVSLREAQLRERPSRRYDIIRDPKQLAHFQFDGEEPSQYSKFSYAEDGENGQRHYESDQASYSANRRSSLRPSMDAPSVSTTTMSYDQNQLERLRDSRLSYLSTGTRTLTSRDTSPDEHSNQNRRSVAKRESRKPPPSALNPALAMTPADRRRSINLPNVRDTHSPSWESNSSTRPPRRQSAYEHSPNMRSPSPITPNFSVPNYNTPVRYSVSREVPPVPPQTAIVERSDTITAKPNVVKKRSSSNSIRPVSTVGNLPSATDWTNRKSPKRNVITEVIHAAQDSPRSVSRASLDTQRPRQSVTVTYRPRPSTSCAVPSDSHYPSRYSPVPRNVASPVPSEPFNFDLPRPATANTKKPRRPASAQVRTYGHAVGHTSQSHSFPTSPPARVRNASPENPPPRTSSRNGVIHNRKSMPALCLPPPVPPPNCPLPPPPPLPSGENVYLNVQGIAKDGGGLVVAPGGDGGEVRRLGARHSFCAMRAGIVTEGAWV